MLTGTVGDAGFSASALAALGIARGVANVEWAGSTTLGSVTVNHGLGVVPKAVVVTMEAAGQGSICVAHAGAWTSTQFTVQAQFVNGFELSAGGTLPVAWVAIH